MTTRMIRHSYGLYIVSGDIFFLHDEEAGHREYPCYVSAESYKYVERLPSVSTPAQSIIWYEDCDTLRYRMTHYVAHWLKENVGGYREMWDVLKLAPSEDSMIFFKRRNDAVKFVRHIKSIINQLKYENND